MLSMGAKVPLEIAQILLAHGRKEEQIKAIDEV